MKIALHSIKVAELVAGFEDKAEEGVRMSKRQKIYFRVAKGKDCHA